MRHEKNIRKDLIEEEIKRLEEIYNVKYSLYKPSKTWIKNLFKSYKVKDCTKFFYDGEPYYNDEDYNMYMDYNYRRKKIVPTGTGVFNTFLNLDKIQEEKEKFRFSKEEHTEEELREAYLKISKLFNDFDKEKRLEYNNWIELYEEGNWESTYKDVEYIVKCFLRDYFNFPGSKKYRFWVAEDFNHVYMYFYARDIYECDYYWTFIKKEKYRKKVYIKPNVNYEINLRFIADKEDSEKAFQKQENFWKVLENDEFLKEMGFNVEFICDVKIEGLYVVECICSINNRLLTKEEWLKYLDKVNIIDAEIFEDVIDTNSEEYVLAMDSEKDYIRNHYIIKNGKVEKFEELSGLKYPKYKVVHDIRPDGGPTTIGGCCPWSFLV